MDSTKQIIDMVQRIKMILVSRATGQGGENLEYVQLRTELLSLQVMKPKLPSFLRICGNLDEFWGFIKETSDNYQGRRYFLREEFYPAISWLEDGGGTPADPSVSAILATVDSEHVRDAWQKSLERREVDPQGAITSARTLIESVCKHILDKTNTSYEDSFDLQKLYTTTAKQLKLSPAQHSEDIFKMILGGCQTVINGMAGLRNSLSDAQGKGKSGAKPAPRHAELAVNLAGSMATFLIATWEAGNSAPRE